MPRPAVRAEIYRVRCGCGLYQTAPMWRERAGAWWLLCLACGLTPWRPAAENARRATTNRRLTRTRPTSRRAA